MIYRSLILLAIAGAVALNISCNHTKHTGASADMASGTWQQQPILVDGDSQDWPSPYPNYDSKAMIGYATANDRDNLYITFEIGDLYTQIKLLQAGATVWIDTSGTKEQVTAIHYPLQNDEKIEIPKIGSQQKDDQLTNSILTQRLKSAIAGENQLTLEGFNGCNGGFAISQNTGCGIRVRLGIDEYKELIWEAAIPFKVLYGKAQLTKQDAGKPISVCFAIKGMKRPAANNNNTDNSTMGNSQMGTARIGGNSSRATGGRMGGQDNPRDRLYENTKTWKQFGLAYQ